MLSRRKVLETTAGAIATTLVRSRIAYAQQRKPNLLYILADDHAGYVLGADGNKLAQTPNLDRFSGEGVRFAKNYCNSPVCTPSRQSFLSSKLPHASGVTVLGTPLVANSPTLARQLKASGYKTAVFGKMHFNVPGSPGLHGFDVCNTEDVVRRRWMAETSVKPIPQDIPVKPPWHPFAVPARVWLDADKLPFPRHSDDMEGAWVVREATRFLQEHRDDPFALWVSFAQPHSPFDFPIEDRDKFSPATFEVPEIGPDDFAQIPLIFQSLTTAEKQGIIASYYTSVAFLDRNIGAVLKALHDLNLENDTLVIYMADHGYSLGQHGRFEKHVCYDPALRVPLAMRWPGHIRGGRTIEEFTESIDVPPTVLELLGVEPFVENHGRSLTSYLKTGTDPAPRQSIFSEYLENEEACIRTDSFKFIQCSGRRLRTDGYLTGKPLPGRTIHLFDLKKDPGEFKNVATEHPDVVQRLSSDMLTVFRSTHPEANFEPSSLSMPEIIDWYLRPRDAVPSPPVFNTAS